MFQVKAVRSWAVNASVLDTKLSFTRSLKDPQSQNQPFLVHRIRMKNSEYVQALLAGHGIRDSAELHGEDGEECCHGQSGHHCY